MIERVKAGNPPPTSPRYRALADDLRARLVAGRLPSPFPTEARLCAEYGVSRFTVREALRLLQTEGLISRRRGSGTLVQPAAVRGGALHQPLSNVAEIFQYARDTRFVFYRDGLASLPAWLAGEVGIDVPGAWARFRGLRTTGDDARPIAFTEAYVHPQLADAAAAVDVGGSTIFGQLERIAAFQIARITQDIRATTASASIAKALAMPLRSPCLRILRCYLDEGGRTVEISASHHPGDRFAYAMHVDTER